VLYRGQYLLNFCASNHQFSLGLAPHFLEIQQQSMELTGNTLSTNFNNPKLMDKYNVYSFYVFVIDNTSVCYCAQVSRPICWTSRVTCGAPN
jgi:hypothetical protein